MTFLVSEAHRAVVFNPPDARVFDVVPTAKPFPYKGHTLAAVPYRLDETRVLRNMGIDLPSPIGYLYEWPRDKVAIPEVMPLQKESSAFLTLNPRAHLLNGIGTGKTITNTWAIDFLLREGTFKKVLVVAPLSTLKDAWENTIFFHFQHLKCNVLYGTAQRRRKLFLDDADIYVINFDGLETIVTKKVDSKGRLLDASFLRDDIGLVVIDEGSHYRNSGTDRYKVLHRALKPHMWCWNNTASPTPQWPTDAWAQCRLVTPTTVPQYFLSFKNKTMRQITQYKWEPLPNAMDIVYEAMRPALRFSRDQVFADLHEPVYEDRSVDLTTAQRKHYQELMNELATEIGAGQIIASNEGVKMMKLVQAACGVLYDRQGQTHEVDCGPRINVVKEIIEQCGEKVIVFAPLEGVVQMLHREISKLQRNGSSVTCEIVHGATSKANRDRIFSSFQRTPDPHVIVAHPGCMAHGLTLTEASTIVWYAPINSNEIYMQANGRITRPGQKVVPMIVNIAATALERKMYTRLKTKTALQGLLLDMVAQGGGV